VKYLNIAPNLKLPPEASTETFAILGRRGSGKTHTAIVMAEEMLSVGIQIVIIDPIDVWFGLRVSKDGKSAGFPIYVCGGSHEDIPLPADGGKVLADAIIDKGLSMVLSVRHLSKTDQRRFVGDFCDRLYDRKADPKHRTALHIFIDEADAFVPQRIMPGAERCFGAVDTLVRRGRSSGLATTLISQRPQVISKDVLSQTEVLVSHQLTGPQDRKALETWIEANDTENKRVEFMASLAALPKGTAWFWSPGLLKIFKRVAVRDRLTFDSSATPKAGVSAVASPKAFAAVDLKALTEELSATIEKAKADDPKQLRAKIQQLEHELKKARSATADVVEIKAPIKEVPVLKGKQLAQLESFCTKLIREAERHGSAMALFWGNLNQVADSLLKAIKSTVQEPSYAPSARAHLVSAVDRHLGEIAARPAGQVRKPIQTIRDGLDISRSQQRILNALIWAEGIGLASLDKTQLALLADHSPTSGGYFNNLGALRTVGLIEYPASGVAMLTAAGRAQAQPVDVPTTSADLQERLYRKLSSSQATILRVVIAQYPKAMRKEQVAEAAGQSPTSGGYFNNLGRLRSLKLIDYPTPGHVVAQPVLFLE
jgi:hypothetical protein